MGVDKVDPAQTLQLAYPPYNSCEDESSGSGKSKTSGQRQIAQPFHAHTGFPCVQLSSIQRPHGENGVHHSCLGKRVQRLRDKTTEGIVAVARVKGCERQNVKRPVFVCYQAACLPVDSHHSDQRFCLLATACSKTPSHCPAI